MIDLADLVPVTMWVCGRCSFRDITRQADMHTQFHSCSGMGGLTMPMVREGERAEVVVNEREDYIGRENVTLVGGIPVMSVTTNRDNGQDVAVYPPTAFGGSGA